MSAPHNGKASVCPSCGEKKWAELSPVSSGLSVRLTKEGMIEEVSEVEVNDIPGDEYQKPRAFQVLRTT